MDQGTLTDADVQALRDITALHMESGKAGDWAAWTSTCTDDLVLLPPDTPRVDGRERAARWFESFPKIVDFSGTPTNIRGDGHMAFTTGIAKATLEVDGEAADVAFKWLAIFERQGDGTWKMVADMWNDEPV